MRILLLSHPATLGSASMPRFAGMIMRGMIDRGHHVECSTSSPGFGRLPARSAFVRKWLGYVDQYLVYPRKLRKLVSEQPANTLFVVTDQALGMWVPFLAHRQHAIHCHDFLALRSALGEFPENPTRWTGRYYQRLIRKGFMRGKTFISVSNKTKEDLHRFLPQPPEISEVVHNGLNHPFRPMDRTERTALLQAAGLRPPDQGIILHVGGNQWYKNRNGVLQIYRAYAASCASPAALWMIGAPPSDSLRKLATSIPGPGEVRFITGLTNEHVNAAYAHAGALVFPSLEEGFGWPVVEAMASYCPVITTDVAPLNEVAGITARFIPRMSSNTAVQRQWAQSAASVLEAVLNLDEVNRSQLLTQGRARATQFDTEAVLTAYESIYLRALGERN